MEIDLSKLDYTFSSKPVVVGGRAMEFYGLRKSGVDIDLIALQEDLAELIKKYPDRVKDLWGDLGVCPFEFEIWKTVCFYDYEFYKEGAVEKDNYFIVSLDRLLYMKTLAIRKEKYLNDVKLIVEKITKDINSKYREVASQNKKILKDIKDIIYIQKLGPEK